MASYNNIESNLNTNYGISSGVENRGLFSRILKNLTNYGMNYDEMVLRNQVGIGINEDPYEAKGSSMYDFFSSRAVSNVLRVKSIPYLDRAYADKRRILREYSIKDEIRDFVSTIADESIVFNEDGDFCFPRALSIEYSQDIHDKYQQYFETIYNKQGFSDGISAWNLMRDLLIDGYLAIEIIYDDKKKNIIGFNRLRPETLVPAYENGIGYLWIQYPEDPQLRRLFLDSQIIYISYTSQNDYSETSYVEGLIKPYNQLKILEQTRIMFNVLNAQIYQKFTVPTKGLSRQKAEQEIGQLIADYSEEVEWDDTLGTLTINGAKHLNLNKQIWFPEGDAGKPDMELMSPTGHDLNDETMLSWFYRALKRASKIPLQRFETDNGGGNLFGDASEMTRDEIKFHNFINRLRSIYKEIIVKPLKLQMLIEYPELKNDDMFLNSVDIKFYTNQIFEEWKKINNMSKKAEVISTLSGIMRDEQTPYFHIEWLMDNIFKLTPEEKNENLRYFMREPKQPINVGGEENMEGNTDFGGDFSSEEGIPETGSGEELGSGGEPSSGGGEEFEF